MKKILLPLAFCCALGMHAFDVHFYKEGANEKHHSVLNASKIVFGSGTIVISTDEGSISEIENSAFAYMMFAASSSTGNLMLEDEPAIVITTDYVTVSSECKSIEVFTLTGSRLAAANGYSCNIGDLSSGTYIARVCCGGKVIVKKFFKHV